MTDVVTVRLSDDAKIVTSDDSPDDSLLSLRMSLMARATNQYDVGDKVRCRALFTDETGAYVDPSALTFSYRAGLTGTVTILVYGIDSELIKEGVGRYKAYIVVNVGDILWYYGFKATGTIVSYEENKFYARLPKLP